MSKSKWNRLIAPGVALAVTVAGVQGVASARPVEEARPTAAAPAVQLVGSTQDGAALLRGVFFMQGEIGRKLEKLPYAYMDAKNLRMNRSPERIQAVDRLLAQVAAEDPAFLPRFSTGMRSGDPYRVEAALADAGVVLKPLLATDSTLARDRARMPDPAVAVVVVATFSVIVAVATVAVVVAVLSPPQFTPTGELAPEQRLETERLLAAFAKELKTI